MAWWETGTTDIEGAAFGNPTRQEAAAARNATLREAAAERLESTKVAAAGRDEAAARSSGAIRGEGTLTKYRPVGGWQDSGPGGSGSSPTLRAAAGDAQLGAPTSFKGGAGAPESIGVIRGLRQTFAPPRQEGQQFIEGEYSTPLRAAQAFNRSAGVGEYESPEGPKLRLVADLENKRPDLKVQANLVREKGFKDVLNERLLKDYGVEDKEKGLILPPEIQRLALGHRPQSIEDVETILGQIKPEAVKAKTINTYNDLKNTETLGFRNRAAALYPNDAKMQEYIKTAPITDTNLGWFQDHFSRVPQPAGPPAASATPAAAETGIIPGTLDRATFLGKTLSYELQPSLRMSGVPAPTLDSVRAERIAERDRLQREENSLRLAVPGAM